MADKEHELSLLIGQALALADELDLLLVGLKLDEARTALSASKGDPTGLSRLERLIGRLPNTMPDRLSLGRNVVTLHGGTSLERLVTEHDVLDARRKSLLKLTEGPPDPSEAETQLIEFGELIQSHRALERRCVYGPLLAKGIDVSIDVGVKLSSLVAEIETDWDSYLHKWDRESIASGWKDFSLATHSILARAGERLKLEEQIIYPLAFVNGMIQLRDTAG